MRVIKGDAEAMFFFFFFVFIIYLQILDSFVSRLDKVVGHLAVFCQVLFFLKVYLFWSASSKLCLFST